MRALLLLLAACATAPVAPAPVAPCPRESAPTVAAASPAVLPIVQPLSPLDEQTVVTKTRAWLDAFDRNDADGVTAPLAKAFVFFDRSRFIERDTLASGIQMRVTQKAPAATRTWTGERVMLGDDSAVFIGEAVIKRPAYNDVPASERTAFHTVVWIREGERWVISLLQMQRSGLEGERDTWNEAYVQGQGYNKQPNKLLVETLEGKKPGTALDIAMGQGRNALYLASKGWKTTGVDISDEGIRQAQAEAATKKLKLTTVQADVDHWDLGIAKWDLVTLIYAGNDEKLVEKIKPSLKKGGLFICEYFSAESELAKTGAGGWATGALAALFKDGYKILRDEVVEDEADWASRRRTKLVRFVAQKL